MFLWLRCDDDTGVCVTMTSNEIIHQTIFTLTYSSASTTKQKKQMQLYMSKVTN